MPLNDIKLKLNNLINASISVKYLLAIFIMAVTIVIAFFLDTYPEMSDLSHMKADTTILQTELSAKQIQTQDYDETVTQVSKLEATFVEQTKKFIDVNEISSQLKEISTLALEQGLQFVLFKPSSRINKDFYSELAIIIKINGSYDELNRFIVALSALPGLITVEDINLKPLNPQGKLILSAVIKSFNTLQPDSCSSIETKDTWVTC